MDRYNLDFDEVILHSNKPRDHLPSVRHLHPLGHTPHTQHCARGLVVANGGRRLSQCTSLLSGPWFPLFSSTFLIYARSSPHISQIESAKTCGELNPSQRTSSIRGEFPTCVSGEQSRLHRARWMKGQTLLLESSEKHRSFVEEEQQWS